MRKRDRIEVEKVQREERDREREAKLGGKLNVSQMSVPKSEISTTIYNKAFM